MIREMERRFWMWAWLSMGFMGLGLALVLLGGGPWNWAAIAGQVFCCWRAYVWDRRISDAR